MVCFALPRVFHAPLFFSEDTFSERPLFQIPNLEEFQALRSTLESAAKSPSKPQKLWRVTTRGAERTLPEALLRNLLLRGVLRS